MRQPQAMRIGYDASVTLLPRPGGIARYTMELLRALVSGSDENDEFVVLLNSLRQSTSSEHGFLLDHPRVKVVRTRWPGPVLLEGWRRGWGPSWESLTGTPCDVLHAPAGYIPRAECPIVVTVHDLAFLRDTQKEALAGRYFHDTYPDALPRVAAIVTPSRFVASEVAATYRISRTRIHAIHSGIAGMFLEPIPSDEDHCFDVLAVSDERVERKRPGLAREVFRLLQRERLTRGEAPLRLASLGLSAMDGVPNAATFQEIPDDELVRVYTQSRVCLLTTREEGFGFPLLESLARRTPVVCGRHSSLEEISGGFAFHPETDDARGFASAVEAVLSSPPDEHQREAYRQHATGFRWAETARHMRQLYEAISRPAGS